jgi:hypothetical protein
MFHQRIAVAFHRWLAGATILVISGLLAHTAAAQQPDTAQRMPGMRMPADTAPTAMSMAGPLGISMERTGSGTTWIPDAVILPSRHFMAGEWMVMLHGFLFGQYDYQEGPRGDEQWGSLNWAMIMADREVGGGQLTLRFMPSLDPWTVGRCGYPVLVQSGETCGGEPLVDRQHPHDFFMELSAVYERAISSNVALLLYAAPAGEPALGPVAFMHRPSAMDEPQAPLSHHWQDATHISFGVLTAGLYTRTLRVEASAFNGHEPDERRWNFDPIRLNSYSGRVTLNPTPNWSFSAGYGRLDNPERAKPPEDMRRLVASAMHGRSLGPDRQWATTLVYGRNEEEGHDPSHSVLFESEAVLDRRNTIFGRAEYVQKSGHDLQIAGIDDDERFNVAAVSLGYIRELARGRGVTLGLGARGSLNVLPRTLEAAYGSRSPLGGMVFLRLRPYHERAHASMGSGHAPAPGHGHAEPMRTPRDSMGGMQHAAGDSGMAESEQLRVMQEIYTRLMADPVIRERVANDSVLQRLMQRLPHGMPAETMDVHAGHRPDSAGADTGDARRTMELVTLLLSDPQIEARVHADPRLHRLWSDPDVQRCLETVRRLKASGQPLPAACPARPRP